jgi:hypothetical protein
MPLQGSDYPEYRVIVERFVGIDAKISELTAEVAPIKKTVDRLDWDFYNHGGPDGLKTQFIKFTTRFDTREEDRKDALMVHEKAVKAALEANEKKVADTLAEQSLKLARRANLQNLWLGIISTLLVLIGILLAAHVIPDFRHDLEKAVLKTPSISLSAPVNAAYVNPKAQVAHW